MKSKYFSIQELVPKAIYQARGEKAWALIDSRLIEMIDLIKSRFPEGTITVNNWMWKGNRQWSGLRTPSCPEYSPTSQHSYGRAVDMLFSAYTVAEVRADILNNPEIYHAIRGVELDVTWLHIDVRNEDTMVSFKA